MASGDDESVNTTNLSVEEAQALESIDEQKGSIRSIYPPFQVKLGFRDKNMAAKAHSLRVLRDRRCQNC